MVCGGDQAGRFLDGILTGFGWPVGLLAWLGAIVKAVHFFAKGLFGQGQVNWPSRIALRDCQSPIYYGFQVISAFQFVVPAGELAEIGALVKSILAPLHKIGA